MRPLLSIVVPTRNRAHTAFHCARALLKMPGDDFEIVIRDCSDDGELGVRLAELPDPRLVYERGSAVSMTDNWNAAMRLASGRFISFIGDDDGFLPWGLEALRRHSDEYPIHCLASDPMRVVYHWPDFSIAGKEALLLFEDFPPTPQLRLQSAKAALHANLSGPSRIPLPGVYHRIISRDVLEEMRDRAGDYFRTVIPDFFSYFAAASILDTYHLVDPPITIAGSCGKSNSSRMTKDRDAHRKHEAEYSKSVLAAARLGQDYGVDGAIADAVEDALDIFGDTESLRLFKTRYVAMTCGSASCLRPASAVAIFLKLQRDYLAARSLSDRIDGTWRYASSMTRFTIRHLDYKLRKFGLYTSGYDKRLNRFEQVQDIYEAIDIVTRVTAAKA